MFVRVKSILQSTDNIFHCNHKDIEAQIILESIETKSICLYAWSIQTETKNVFSL